MTSHLLPSALRLALAGALIAACSNQSAPATPTAMPRPPSATTSAAPKRILFIGNSLTYENDVPALVAAIAAADGQAKPDTRSIAFADFGLPDHWDQGDALKAIAQGGWDVVVMQQGPSALPESRRVLLDYAQRFAEEIRKVGATPAFYMVWPARENAANFIQSGNSYALAAHDTGSLLLPAGDAWRMAWQRDACLPLYSPDDLHASKLGAWLAALVIYGGIYGRTPDQAVLDLGVDGAAAQAVREAASEAVAGAEARVRDASSAVDASYALPRCSASLQAVGQA